MKSITSIIVAAVWVAAPAIAEDHRPGEKKDAAQQQRSADWDRAGHKKSPFNRLNQVEKASDIIGTEVRNYREEKLGKVDDLGVSLESGRIAIAVLSVGGLLGVGDTHIAVPPGALHFDPVKKVVHLDADKEKLKSAPRLELSKWETCCDSSRIGEVYRYYGYPAYFSTADVPGRDPVDKTPGVTKPAYRGESAGPLPIGPVSKASKLVGMAVRNNQDEKLGKVENLMVDFPASRLVAVIVSSGGFLGLGDELSAVPPAAFHYTADRDALILDASKESLGKAPHFKANDWPAFDQRPYTESVYRAYRIEPYFAPRSTDADNTRKNVRDRDDLSLTPLDQGNSAADIDMTARIRKEIVADKEISVNGRNVKVITSNGRVTLRGTVNSEEERRRIASIARTLASSDQVDDQIEVKVEK